MKKTPLYNTHLARNAKMVSFHGYLMPLQYDSIIHEHTCVRNTAGLFDISHMGRFEITGNKASLFVQRLVTNDVDRLSDKQVLYTPMCNEQGGILDDILVYKWHKERFTLVVNCSNAEKDFLWMQKQSVNYQPIQIKDLTDSTSLITLQGPRSGGMLQTSLNVNPGGMKKFFFDDFSWDGTPIMVSRTGYTGEDGYEIFVNNRDVVKLWDLLLKQNEQGGVKPAGLGARNTLRLEAALLLYGDDIDESTTPLETPVAWTVKFDKGSFIGKESLLLQRSQGVERKLAGFEMIDRGIPRHGYAIVKGTETIGKVASGSFSPSTNKNIGFCLIKAQHAAIGNEFLVRIRENDYKARIVQTPFYKRKPGNECT